MSHVGWRRLRHAQLAHRALDADACAGAWIGEQALHGAAPSGSITRRALVRAVLEISDVKYEIGRDAGNGSSARARALIQTSDRASRCLTLVSEKRIIDLI